VLIIQPLAAPAPAPAPALAPRTAVVAASGGSASLALADGRQALLSLDGAALADLGADKKLALAYDPAPALPNEAAAGSLGGGNVQPLGKPMKLNLGLRDAAGQEIALPASHADRKVELRLPVLVHPQEPNVQMAWLMEVKDANGQFFGYMRVPAEFEPATNSLVYRVALSELRDALVLPALIVPAYVKNHDAKAHIWSSPMGDAVDFGEAAPQFTFFRVVGPQVGTRIFVHNPATDNYGWIDASGVGNVGAAS
jgi:hypothetical protein